MSRSRCTLHINKLADFTAWLEGKGWKKVETKDHYEALRMTHKSKYGLKTLLVHRKDSATEHLTTWGESEQLVQKWLREREAA